MKSGILPEVRQYWLKAAVRKCGKHPWNKVLLVLQRPASLRLGWLCYRSLESFADSSSVTCCRRWFTPVCINSLWCLCFPGGDHGSAGTEVSSSQQDCLLHHGGGGGREAPDWPGRGIQTNVSASHYILQQKEKKKKRWQFSNFPPLFSLRCIQFMSTQVFFCKAKLMYPIKILIFPHPILAVLCSARCKWALQHMYRLFWGPNVFSDAFNSRAFSWWKYERGTWLKGEIRGEQREGNEGVCGCVFFGGWEHKLHVLMYMWLLFAFTNCLYLVRRK